MAEAAVQIVPPLKLDLGCGKNKLPGFTGVDERSFEGVDDVRDLTQPWPWETSSVDEVHCSHFVEHLEPDERIHFVNELWRVLKPGAQARLVTPHWASMRAYGDLTHKWPPVSVFWLYYLDRGWREVNAPHNDAYVCDFGFVAHYTHGPELTVRSDEHKAFALSNYIDAAHDLVMLLTARK